MRSIMLVGWPSHSDAVLIPSQLNDLIGLVVALAAVLVTTSCITTAFLILT
jgi:hypothetical protein